MKYELRHMNKQIGDVSVCKKGLFYEINCCFRLDRKEKFHLVAVTGNGETDLGECRCNVMQFSLRRNLPIKEVGQELLWFYITAECNNGNTYLFYADRPFPYISRLADAVLIISNGKKKIRL